LGVYFRVRVSYHYLIDLGGDDTSDRTNGHYVIFGNIPKLFLNFDHRSGKRFFILKDAARYEMSSRHTITLNEEAYLKMKSKGVFGESYSELVTRLADLAETSIQSSEKQELKNDAEQ
jgi:predicted CopG family antitoxin